MPIPIQNIYAQQGVVFDSAENALLAKWWFDSAVLPLATCPVNKAGLPSLNWTQSLAHMRTSLVKYGKRKVSILR